MDGSAVVAGDSFDEVAQVVVERLLAEPRDVLTLLTGEDAPALEGLTQFLEERHPRLELEVQDAEGPGKLLVITLKYGRNRERSIAGVRRISKPGLRVYAKHTGLPKVLGGLGVAIISTSQGLLTDRQANQKGVGGEVLAYVW